MGRRRRQAARIEQLLVTGLDHYFAGRFDAAIHVWTRVLFLDRHHDRARAYIERARSAQAERHRQGDVLLHEGFAAFDRGDVERARELMAQAMAMGASQDAALGVLGRIERLDVGASSGDDASGVVTRVRRRPRRAWLARPRRTGRRSAPTLLGAGRGRGPGLAGASWWVSSTGAGPGVGPRPPGTSR